MKIGFIGLGKMGASMSLRLLHKGNKVIAFDLNKKALRAMAKKGAYAAGSLKELIEKLNPPRIIWVMVPSGKATEETVDSLYPFLESGDIIIDGGNSYYKDSIRRAKKLKKKGAHFIDAGTSGGTWGLKNGYCLMIGGEKGVFKKVEPLFKALAPEGGYAYVGPAGAGHFVKMVHNGIEYALLQGYAEGFSIMQAKKEFNLDLAKICRLWNKGSVIRSWLLELSEDMFKKFGDLSSVKGYVEDSGEGRWTVQEAIEKAVPAPAITIALEERIRSRIKETFSSKVIAALRHEFGGHEIKRKTHGKY